MGSLKIEIVGRNDGWLQKPTTFEIEVVGQGAPFAVQRRYTEFLELEAALRSAFPDLPSMPPRSYVVRRLNPGFLDAREKDLGELLDAAVAADPMISAPALRAFLGLEQGCSDIGNCEECEQCQSAEELSTSFECALCLQCFQHPRALNCHLKFAHGWEPLSDQDGYYLDEEVSADLMII
jgi:hypothetical protein